MQRWNGAWRIAFLGVTLMASKALGFDHNHSELASILKKYQIEDGRIKYQSLKNDTAKDSQHALLKYIRSLEGVSKKDYGSFSREQKMAFLINAYNALTLKLIVDEWGGKDLKTSIRDINKFFGLAFGRPWSLEFFSLLEGDIKTLDPIEKEYLIAGFKDPRIHAAVNCASMSCPRLHSEPFVATRLNEQLDYVMADFLADDCRNQYNPSTGEMLLSHIFKWYKDDFDPMYGGYLKAIAKVGPDAAKKAVAKAGDKKISWLDYNWDLNDADRKDTGLPCSPKASH